MRISPATWADLPHSPGSLTWPANASVKETRVEHHLRIDINLGFSIVSLKIWEVGMPGHQKQEARPANNWTVTELLQWLRCNKYILSHQGFYCDWP
jgi:hypothetical protein